MLLLALTFSKGAPALEARLAIRYAEIINSS